MALFSPFLDTVGAVPKCGHKYGIAIGDYVTSSGSYAASQNGAKQANPAAASEFYLRAPKMPRLSWMPQNDGGIAAKRRRAGRPSFGALIAA